MNEKKNPLSGDTDAGHESSRRQSAKDSFGILSKWGR